jgi:hypothetical protein
LTVELVYVKAFERLTLIFSETKVPLIHQVIPALLKLHDRLQTTVKTPEPNLHPLLRVAARASLRVFDKYMQLFEESNIYWVALGTYVSFNVSLLNLADQLQSDVSTLQARVV